MAVITVELALSRTYNNDDSRADRAGARDGAKVSSGALAI